MAWLLVLLLPLFAIQDWAEQFPKLGPGLNLYNLSFLVFTGYAVFKQPDRRVARGVRPPLTTPLLLLIAVLFLGLFTAAGNLGLPAPLSLDDEHVKWFRDIMVGILFYFACRVAPKDEKTLKWMIFALALP